MARAHLLHVFLLAALLLSITPDATSQEVLPHRMYRTSDTELVIYYSLPGNAPRDVTVSFSPDGGGTWRLIDEGLSGHAGTATPPGQNRRIVWRVPADLRGEAALPLVKVTVDGATTSSLPAEPDVPDYFGDCITAARITGTVQIDGVLDEPHWETIDPLPLVMQVPRFGESPSERTELLIAYDDEYVYFGARCFDSEPDGVQATTYKRDDDADSSDSVGFLLDTFNDNENALAFITTPTGSRIDKSIYGDMMGGGSASGGISSSWNTFWDAAVSRTKEGWFAEMRIPFSSLRFQDEEGVVIMSFTAWRWIARKDELDVFPAITRRWGRSSHLKASRAHDIRFENISSRTPLYITPYALAGVGRVTSLNDEGTAYDDTGDEVYEGGVDVKYGLTNNLTLDLTYNTDFAQVEADDQQVNLTRFPLFFPEKRLFFLERESNFDFRFYGRNRLFHSRRIGIRDGARVPIYGGARVVGRVGKWDIGVLDMQTEEAGETPSENFGVVRMRRQVLNPYTYFGGIVTSRAGTDGSYNAAYGLDGIIRVFGDDYLKLNWAQTFEDGVENPDPIDNAKVRAHWERYSHLGWAYGLNYSRAGKDYNPGMGFEQYGNLTNYIHFVRYGWISPAGSIWNQHDVYEDLWLHIRNEDNSTQTCLVRAGWHGSTKSGYGAGFSLMRNTDNVRSPLAFSGSADVPPGTYDYWGCYGRFSTPSGRLFSLSSRFEGGQFYDGRRITCSLSPRRSISSHLEIGGSYQINLVDFPDRNQEFTAHVGQFRFLAMLNVKYSITTFVQYNSAQDRAIMNLRFRYNPREGSDLYLVYDEGYNTDREGSDPLMPLSTDRTVMLKYSYTFNL